MVTPITLVMLSLMICAFRDAARYFHATFADDVDVAILSIALLEYQPLLKKTYGQDIHAVPI